MTERQNSEPAAVRAMFTGFGWTVTAPEPEHCITCGTALTDDDPVVTTLGPRCRRHF